jgi:hypothetical protein
MSTWVQRMSSGESCDFSGGIPLQVCTDPSKLFVDCPAGQTVSRSDAKE